MKKIIVVCLLLCAGYMEQQDVESSARAACEFQNKCELQRVPR